MSIAGGKKRSKSDHEVDVDLDSSVEDEENTAELSMEELCRKFLPMIPRLDNKLKKLTTAIKTQNMEIEKLNEKVHNLESSMESLSSENERLYRQVNERWLVLSGLKENKSETNSSLLNQISSLIVDKIGLIPDIAAVYRFGAAQRDKPRQIKILFHKLAERNSVWKDKKKLGNPYFLMEDLHRRERLRRAILWKFGKEHFKNGKSVVYKFNKKMVTVDGSAYVLEGDTVIKLRSNE